MNINEAFPSKYLKASDLHGKSIPVVIDRVEMEDIGDESAKPVLYFQNKQKGMVLNRTNSNNISLLYGDDTDDWAGRQLVLFEAMVDFRGKTVPAIRVRGPQAKDKPHQQIPAKKLENSENPADGMNDDIQF